MIAHIGYSAAVFVLFGGNFPMESHHLIINRIRSVRTPLTAINRKVRLPATGLHILMIYVDVTESTGCQVVWCLAIGLRIHSTIVQKSTFDIVNGVVIDG